ncbi:MAG: SlyX family protein [Deltaproteobacteria bacterium]
MTTTTDDDRVMDLEIKLAYQDKLIRELDALVRTFGEKLDETAREVKELKQSLKSPEGPTGPANEQPPHY